MKWDLYLFRTQWPGVSQNEKASRIFSELGNKWLNSPGTKNVQIMIAWNSSLEGGFELQINNIQVSITCGMIWLALIMWQKCSSIAL